MTAPRKPTRLLDRRVVHAGQILIREGDTDENAFFIQSGRFEVFKNVRSEPVKVATLGPNTVVGEMALIMHSPRTATVRCVEDGQVVVIDRDTFDAKLAAADPVLRGLLKMFAASIKQLTEDYSRSLRQVGAPPPGETGPATGSDPAPEAAREMDQQGKFNMVKALFAQLYHPSRIGDRAAEDLTRVQVFNEFWPMFESVERQDPPCVICPPACLRNRS